MRIRKARLGDAAAIHALVSEFAREEILLPRTLEEIHAHIRSFVVAEESGRVMGCGALHFYGSELAEVRSVAVARAARRRGAGSRVVRALLREARRHQVQRVFLLTRIPDYFARLGFAATAPENFPEKIWRDCLRCPRANCCDETAMVFAEMQASAAAGAPAAPTLRVLAG